MSAHLLFAALDRNKPAETALWKPGYESTSRCHVKYYGYIWEMFLKIILFLRRKNTKICLILGCPRIGFLRIVLPTKYVLRMCLKK